MARTLTRRESKAITRRRLIEAASGILAGSGYAGLSASAVSRAAGVAQPTFYVHFRDKDDLVRSLADEQLGLMRKRLRDARARVIAGGGVDAVRDSFRVPLDVWISHPGLFRLHVQESHQPGSPIGEMARQLRADLHRDLVDDLMRLGLPAKTRAQRERVEMIAEGMLAQTEALALGFVEGRFTSRDAVVDVLTQFAVGVLGLAGDGES